MAARHTQLSHICDHVILFIKRIISVYQWTVGCQLFVPILPRTKIHLMHA